MQLAELNIAGAKYPLEDSRIADFMNNLQRINGLAESMPGFVWMLKDEAGSATEIETPFDDNMIVNMSVWKSAEQLEQFVWNTVHKQFYNRKNEWFSAMQSHHFVMWWVEDGHQPDLTEAKQRLDHLDKHGNSDHAFDWSHLPHVKLWQQQSCA